ncbi:MAG: di-heme oxidoredictase family protein [Candidatus Acidiferrales bacterium]
MIFRIPTPLFGTGLIENISDETILANMNANSAAKQALGIFGHPNHNGNDGTIARFGWKAQNKSLELFAGEAYNVEMGVTNELFTNERPSPDEELHGGLPASCLLNPTPEDSTNFTVSALPDPEAYLAQVPSDIVQFAMFMRLLAPPTPSVTGIPGNPSPQSIANGRQSFITAGCNLCHTPTLQTATSSFTAGLNDQSAALFSDLLVHHMGTRLADGVSQGTAGPDEFRSAPLWGIGQRIFFLHDGRTTDLRDAIEEHASPGSEANAVIQNYNNLTWQQQQDLLNFLRSL